MTTTVMKRCKHCKSTYQYHPSTYGFVPKYNSSDYCPTCLEVVEKALHQIPIKFYKKFIPSNDYTREQIVEAQETRLNNGVPVKRIRMTVLYDLEDYSCQQNVCEMMPDPITKIMYYYSASWWPKKPNEVEITKEVWWDSENKKIADIQNF